MRTNPAINLETVAAKDKPASMTITYKNRITCAQPGCLMKRPGFNASELADITIRLLAGETLNRLVSSFEMILARPQCKQCALHVMEGKKTFPTAEEWKHLDDLGQWYGRRQRRKHRMRTGYSRA